MFSVPNEGVSAWETQKKVNTGLLRGAADCIVLLPNAALFAECKTSTGVQSKAQKEFQSRVETLGFTYFIYRSLEEFQKNILTWLNAY